MDTSPPKKKAKLEDESVTTGLNAKNNPIHIDPNGNLKLIVGPAAVQMQVDANALRRSSKVFDRMLFGGFREAHKTDDWTVELPEDDPDALRVIFHAAHANFQDLPVALNLSQLYSITVVADKYDMVRILQPWMGNWTSAEKHPELWASENENETSFEDLQRLCVLYHQGLSQQFKEYFLRVVIKTKTNRNGQLLYRAVGIGDGEGSGSAPYKWVEFGMSPCGIFEYARRRRVNMVCMLVRFMDQAFKSYTSEEDGPEPHRRCRYTALGLLIQHLVRESIWPLPSGEKVCLSISELSGVADRISEQINKITTDCECFLRKRSFRRCQLISPIGFDSIYRRLMEKEISLRFENHFEKLAAKGIGSMEYKDV